jgi:hypothetical protein
MNASTSRAMVMAKPSGGEPKPAPSSPSIPIQMGSGRVPEGGQGINNMAKVKTIFDGSGASANPNLNQVRMAGQKEEPTRTVVIARRAMGQESEASAPSMPATPKTDIVEVLIREGGPQGLTRQEAGDIAAALQEAIVSSVSALEAGETCLGVDSVSIESAKDIQIGLQRFSVAGNPMERLDLRARELDLVEKILECGTTYERLKAADKGRTMAFVGGGLIIGAVVLLVLT